MLTAVESVKQDLHRLDQNQATLMMEEPPMPPMAVIFQPSMAMVQATKIQPKMVIRKPQIWTTRIFIFDAPGAVAAASAASGPRTPTEM